MMVEECINQNITYGLPSLSEELNYITFQNLITSIVKISILPTCTETQLFEMLLHMLFKYDHLNKKWSSY